MHLPTEYVPNMDLSHVTAAAAHLFFFFSGICYFSDFNFWYRTLSQRATPACLMVLFIWAATTDQ